MLARVKHDLGVAAARTAQTAVLGTVALTMLLVGLAFLTLSAWLVLQTVTTPAIAALTIGSFYVGFALLTVVVMSQRNHKRQNANAAPVAPDPTPAEATLATVLAAFTTGVTAGRKARQ